MLHVNDIASWYALFHEDRLKIHLLTLLALICFKSYDYDICYEEFTFDEEGFNFGITDYNIKLSYTHQEIYILKLIQHLYGYYSTQRILDYVASKKASTIKQICTAFKFEMISDYESFASYDFNEYVIVKNEIIFYIQIGTILSDRELSDLSNYQDQESYVVYRNETTGKLVIY